MGSNTERNDISTGEQIMNSKNFQMQQGNTESRKAARWARQITVMLVVAAFLTTSWLSRVKADAGDLDPSFGNGGIVVADFGFDSSATSLLIQADGKLVVAGTGGSSGAAGFLVARYHPNGSLDSSFGSGGLVITDFGGSETVTGAALDPSGRIVVAGMVNDSSGQKAALARYKTDGSLDAT